MRSHSSARPLKRALSLALGTGGLLRADLATRGDVVIAVNYHGTPRDLSDRLLRQLTFYRDNFECLGEDELLGFLGGAIRLRRPGIVISFDDGLASHAEVAAPMLEMLGLRGWFLLPGEFLDTSRLRQEGYFRGHIRAGHDAEHPEGERGAAMTWEQARALSRRGHVVGCHTWTHRCLGPRVSREVVDEEVNVAKRELESRLGRRVRSFAWVRGEVRDYSAAAQALISSSFDLAFTSMSRAIRRGDDPHRLHRFNVEASYPLSVAQFQISRINEAWFARRRRAAVAATGP